ncbi:uncharacterized protein LOC113508126 [Trichoplusia ni]|uniref:Uncharacterized protein LOC113508126 n=1 Tax=Trichoplusia ni TaxID=7111 RepID=A0A7E5X389_TRINI|nr:uncharacterized protein LOC113508126 [Trichoplusia ni]
MGLLSEKYDVLLAEHEESKKKISHLEKSIQNANNKCVYLEKANMALEQKLHDIEQSSRKQNIEIIGIEQLPEENPMQIINKLGQLLEVNSENVEWASRHQQRKTNDKPAPIVVSFKSTNMEDRNVWLTNRLKLKNIYSDAITGGSQKNKIYINEDLTKHTRELLWNTKNQLKEKFKYIWIHNGKILVKKSDGDNSTWIKSEDDLRELLKKSQHVTSN